MLLFTLTDPIQSFGWKRDSHVMFLMQLVPWLGGSLELQHQYQRQH